MRINGKLNSNNIDLFEKNQFDGKIKYTCLLCKKKKDIFHMISNHGARMICTCCAKERYGSELKALELFCLNRPYKKKR